MNLFSCGCYPPTGRKLCIKETPFGSPPPVFVLSSIFSSSNSNIYKRNGRMCGFISEQFMMRRCYGGFCKSFITKQCLNNSIGGSYMIVYHNRSTVWQKKKVNNFFYIWSCSEGKAHKKSNMYFVRMSS